MADKFTKSMLELHVLDFISLANEIEALLRASSPQGKFETSQAFEMRQSLETAVKNFIKVNDRQNVKIVRSRLSEFILTSNVYYNHFTGKELGSINYDSELGSLFENLSAEVFSILSILSPYEEIMNIPSEVPAPLRVGISNGVIVAINSQHHIGTIDYDAANRIREELYNNLRDMIEDYSQGSNVDRRYITACGRLLQHLAVPMERVSIEALGLNYQLVERMTKRLADEMSGVVVDVMENTLAGIGVLLRQFKEWRDYLEELTKNEYKTEDGSVVLSQGQRLISELDKPGIPVDKSVIDRLKDMIEPAVSGIIAADTVAIPLICSYSNLFALLANIAIEHLPGTNAPMAIAGSSVVLASFASEMLKKFCSVLSQFQPLKFIVDVAALVTKYYSQGKDVFISKS